MATDTEAARNMRDLGQTMAWLGKAIKDHTHGRSTADVRE